MLPCRAVAPAHPSSKAFILLFPLFCCYALVFEFHKCSSVLLSYCLTAQRKLCSTVLPTASFLKVVCSASTTPQAHDALLA